MSINDILEKIKPFYTLILLIMVASIFFALGRLSALESRKTSIKIENMPASLISSQNIDSPPLEAQGSLVNETNSNSSEVIGSKSGKKYYFPWCGTVKRIKPENQIKFSSITEAKNAGFLPGGNCKGLN